MRCEICASYEQPISQMYPGQQYECCHARHRRVHSVSHIEYGHPARSPLVMRAMSCSPSRSPLTHGPLAGSPLVYQSPSHQGRLYSPVFHQEVEHYSGMYGLYGHRGPALLRETSPPLKTTASVHETTSKTSLLSTSESDHSMECTAPAPTHMDLVAARTENGAYSLHGGRPGGIVYDRARMYKVQK